MVKWSSSIQGGGYASAFTSHGPKIPCHSYNILCVELIYDEHQIIQTTIHTYRFIGLMSYFSKSSFFKSWRHVQILHFSCLPQYSGITGMKKNEMNSLRFTGSTELLWQFGHCNALGYSGIGVSKSLMPKMKGIGMNMSAGRCLNFSKLLPVRLSCSFEPVLLMEKGL